MTPEKQATAESPDILFALGDHETAVNTRLDAWRRVRFLERMWARGHTPWAPKPQEVSDRLGWLWLPGTMTDRVAELESFAREVAGDGIRHVVLMGMGGSSLAPEVFQKSFGNAGDRPALSVLDSTHPEAVRRVEAGGELSRTLFVVSSKSGTTAETLSFMKYFWSRLVSERLDPGPHFVAITDPDTPLEALARERKFRRTFLAPTDVGGRFSALSVFGLVPAALIGVDLRRLLERATKFAASCSASVDETESSALRLGAALGELALEKSGKPGKRDKLTLVTSPGLASFPDWVEQLVAESTGKKGFGIVPVVGEPAEAGRDLADDRVVVEITLAGDLGGVSGEWAEAARQRGVPLVRIRLDDPYDLGREFYRWELATAAAGAVFGINPFDQPDVQLAKTRAKEAMEKITAKKAAGGDGETAALAAEVSMTRPDEVSSRLRELLGQAHAGDYLALQAYLPPGDPVCGLLDRIRSQLSHAAGQPLATTLGFGPRFLHSTGQLHKGGAQNGIFLQLVDQPAPDLEVPETDYSFGELIWAQGLGDYLALDECDRRVLRVRLGSDVVADLEKLESMLRRRP